jgi:hypothetical protein
LCGTYLEELRKRLKNTHLGVELLNGVVVGVGPFEIKLTLIAGGLLRTE